jgi:hypothetical protein
LSWVRFDDVFPNHPKVNGLSNEAFRLHVSAMCHANHFLTDGAITTATADSIAAQVILRLRYSIAGVTGECDPRDLPPPERVVAELLKAGIWHATKTGYAIHDFSKYQRLRAEVEEGRALQLKGQERGGMARAAGARRDGSGRLLSNDSPAYPASPPASLPAPHQPHSHSPLKTLSSSEGESSTEDTVRPEANAAFEKLWKEYPRRVGKVKVRAIWKRLKPEERERASDAVVLFAAVWKLAGPDRRRFIPLPATWLGQGRYDDDVAEWSRQAAPEPENGKAKSPGLVGSHGHGDVLVGEPGSPERAAAMAAAKEKT